MTAPAINVHTFPYQRKWTKDELDDVYSRFDKLRQALTDAVGPSGQRLYTPPDMIAIQALHLALAGGDVSDEKAFIWARERDDDGAMFQGELEWLVKKDTPPPPTQESQSEAAQIKAQIDRGLSPAQRAELARLFIADYKSVTGEDNQ